MSKNSVNRPSATIEHGIDLLMTRLNRTSKNWKWVPLKACQSRLTWPGLKHDNTCLAVVTQFLISRHEKQDFPSELFQSVQLLMVPWSGGTQHKRAVIQYFILASPPKIKAVILPFIFITIVSFHIQSSGVCSQNNCVIIQLPMGRNVYS